MKTFLLILFIFGTPFFVWAQDGSRPPATDNPATSTPVEPQNPPAPPPGDTGGAATSGQGSVTPAPQSPTTTPIATSSEQAPRSSVTPRPAPRAPSPLPGPAQNTTVPEFTPIATTLPNGSEDSGINFPIMGAIIAALAVLGFGGYALRKRNNTGPNQCEPIKRELDRKKTTLARITVELNLKEQFVTALKDKVKANIENKVINKTLELDKTGALKSAKKVKDEYESIRGKIESTESAVAILRRKHEGFTAEVRALESAYKACVASVASKDVASGIGDTLKLFKTTKPTVHLFCGLPASGKTTLAEKVERELGIVRLSLDQELFKKFGKNFDPKLYPEYESQTKESLKEQIKDALKSGKSVTLDYGFWKKSERDEYKKLAKSLGADVKLYYFKAKPDKLKNRLADRNDNNHKITPQMFDSFAQQFETPRDEGETVVEFPNL